MRAMRLSPTDVGMQAMTAGAVGSGLAGSGRSRRIALDSPELPLEYPEATVVPLGPVHGPRAIEDETFPFEALSDIAEVESWRKEINRPLYHIHKWWAQRLGAVFRA